MDSTSVSPSLTACMIDLESSKPNQFAKEHCGESYLVCVKEEEAKKIATDYANFINREFGVEENLTEKQKSLLGNAIKIPSKRKATKSASGSRPKKAPKVASGKRKPKKQRKLLLNVIKEEAEQADAEAALAKVAAFETKEKEKEKQLANSWDSGIEPNKDAHIDFVLSPEAAALISNGVYSYPKPKSSKPPQISSQPTLTNQIFDVADTGDTNSGHLSEIEEETPPHTPRPKNTPPHRSIMFIDQA
ncbi:hypothetical protein QL285_070201 [Trifolium repens]|nr:hypothetical protein QL285_070201 [Trifolium repens]